jgi:hypothetical protein
MSKGQLWQISQTVEYTLATGQRVVNAIWRYHQRVLETIALL